MLVVQINACTEGQSSNQIQIGIIQLGEVRRKLDAYRKCSFISIRCASMNRFFSAQLPARPRLTVWNDISMSISCLVTSLLALVSNILYKKGPPKYLQAKNYGKEIFHK